MEVDFDRVIFFELENLILDHKRAELNHKFLKFKNKEELFERISERIYDSIEDENVFSINDEDLFSDENGGENIMEAFEFYEKKYLNYSGPYEMSQALMEGCRYQLYSIEINGYEFDRFRLLDFYSDLNIDAEGFVLGGILGEEFKKWLSEK